MNFPDVQRGRDLQDAFEFLFEKYSSLPAQQLPRFKKRRRASQNNSGRLQSTSSAETPSVATPVGYVGRSDEGGRPDNDHRLTHQASFSSGVFSIDSDHDILPDGDASRGSGRSDEGEQTDGGGGFKDLTIVKEDSPPGQDSGIVSHRVSRRRGASSLQEPEFMCQGNVKEAAAAEDLKQSEEPNATVLTDEDILFMMFKPRLKMKKKGRKKKKKKEKHKLDLDDLWVKGQHRWTVPGKETEVESAKLFLDRNLRRGRLSLKNYICTLRKMRSKRKKNNNNHSKAHMKSSSDSNLQDNTMSSCKLKKVSVSKAQKTAKPKKEETRKKSISARTVTSSRDGKTSKTSKRCPSRSKGMTVVIPSSDFDICSSDSASALTQNPRDVLRGEKAGGRVCQEEDSDSEDSIINFVSLTPRKTRRRQMRTKTQRRRVSSTSLTDSEASGSRGRQGRRTTLHEPVVAPSNQWDDWDADYQPLFGRSGHCGGVWQSIVEESS
ncbi:uncharacterized protein [Diadema antillarum]|uniref:uncharacterized protein n=1 Tax=Diadema antillarum TaxID=105358 RepID=UPI003A83645D